MRFCFGRRYRCTTLEHTPGLGSNNGVGGDFILLPHGVRQLAPVLPSLFFNKTPIRFRFEQSPSPLPPIRAFVCLSSVLLFLVPPPEKNSSTPVAGFVGRVVAPGRREIQLHTLSLPFRLLGRFGAALLGVALPTSFVSVVPLLPVSPVARDA